jgi:hypothetical protein
VTAVIVVREAAQSPNLILSLGGAISCAKLPSTYFGSLFVLEFVPLSVPSRSGVESRSCPHHLEPSRVYG